jgi:hypothetical protein
MQKHTQESKWQGFDKLLAAKKKWMSEQQRE